MRKYILLILLFMFVCLPPGLLGQPVAEKMDLENGMHLIYENNTSSRITVVQMFIPGGKRVEPDGKAGVAYLTTRLTLEIPDQDKIQDMMDQATRLYMACRNDYTLITIACLSENLEDTLKLTSQIIRKPLFSGLRIDRIKKQMDRRRAIETDEAANTAHFAFTDIFFNSTPYVGPVYGSEKSVKAIKKRDINQYFENYFLTGNMYFSISSDLEKKSITELLEKYYTDFPGGRLPDPEPLTFSAIENSTKKIPKDSRQTFIAAGFLLPQISRRNYMLAYITDTYLGKGVGSRLWELRAKEKLAYNVNTRITYSRAGGILEAFLETDNINQAKAKSALLKILDEVCTEGMTEEDLRMTKAYAASQFMQHNEVKEDRTRTLGYMEMMGLGFDYFADFLPEIESVSLQEINSFLKEILAAPNRALVILGPPDSIPLQ